MKYNEKKILQDIENYIGTTYSEHYVMGDRTEESTQLMDFIVEEDLQTAFGFLKYSVIKYLLRLGKKEGFKKQDLYKAAHYIVLILHKMERENTIETNSTD